MDPVAHLKSRILLVLAAVPLAGCHTEASTECLFIDEAGAECPSAEEALDELNPDACGEKVVSVDGEAEVEGDTGGTRCCYPVTRIDSTPFGECEVIDGRPLRGERGAIYAAPVRSEAWSHGPVPSVDGLTPELRAELAAAWTSAALAEHASVASFAKVVLELMAFGAPADLVAATQAAAADEVRHARRCFALASDYAGVPIGPGALPVGEVRLHADLAAFAAATVREGCVGETLASLLATEAFTTATDPAVRAVLDGIVRDETRHAALAWKTVQWALAVGGAPVRRAVAAAFAEALVVGVAAMPEGLVEGGAAHGRLDAARARDIVARGLAEVLAPCAAALLRDVGGSREPVNA